mgnify:CR=1 FL=1
MDQLINLTPHKLNIVTENGTVTVEPSGTIARCSVTNTPVRILPNGVTLYRTVYGEVTGLPEEQEGTIYVVSGLVRGAVPTRLDVASPGELIRNEEGQPVGCNGLSING